MTPGSFQALWGCSGQCTLVYFCSLLLTVLLPQHVSFTSHIPFWGVFDLTWVLHGLHFLRASLCHSGVLPSGNFQLCSHQYALVQSSKPASLLASSQVLFWDSSPTSSHPSSIFCCLLPLAADILPQAHLIRGTVCPSGWLKVWDMMGCLRPF